MVNYFLFVFFTSWKTFMTVDIKDTGLTLAQLGRFERPIVIKTEYGRGKDTNNCALITSFSSVTSLTL
jgi:hypothetical protein